MSVRWSSEQRDEFDTLLIIVWLEGSSCEICRDLIFVQTRVTVKVVDTLAAKTDEPPIFGNFIPTAPEFIAA